MLDPHQFDRPGVIDQRINPPKMFGGLSHGRFHGFFVTHIQLQGQGFTACGFNFGGHRVDGARQFGMRLGAFRRDNDIGAIAGRAQGDFTADATAGAGDKQGFT